MPRATPATDRTCYGRNGIGELNAVMAGSHAALGLAAWAWAAPHLGAPTLDPVALALAAAGSLLPDVDHPQSWAGRRLRVLSRPLAAAFGHRGATHSLLAVLGISLLLHWDGVSRAVSEPLVIGYLSHLGADLLTPAGLPLFWPLRRNVAVPLGRAGSSVEIVVVAAILAWTAYAAPGLHHPWQGL